MSENRWEEKKNVGWPPAIFWNSAYSFNRTNEQRHIFHNHFYANLIFFFPFSLSISLVCGYWNIWFRHTHSHTTRLSRGEEKRFGEKDGNSFFCVVDIVRSWKVTCNTVHKSLAFARFVRKAKYFRFVRLNDVNLMNLIVTHSSTPSSSVLGLILTKIRRLPALFQTYVCHVPDPK